MQMFKGMNLPFYTEEEARKIFEADRARLTDNDKQFYDFRESLAIQEIPKIEKVLRDFFSAELMEKISITTVAQVLRERDQNNQISVLLNFQQTKFGVFTGLFNWGELNKIALVADVFIGRAELAKARVWQFFEKTVFKIPNKFLLAHWANQFPISREHLQGFLFFGISKLKNYDNLPDFFFKEIPNAHFVDLRLTTPEANSIYSTERIVESFKEVAKKVLNKANDEKITNAELLMLLGIMDMNIFQYSNKAVQENNLKLILANPADYVDNKCFFDREKDEGYYIFNSPSLPVKVKRISKPLSSVNTFSQKPTNFISDTQQI